MPDPNSQLCTSVNEENEIGNFTPCSKRFVFAIDYSLDIPQEIYNVNFNAFTLQTTDFFRRNNNFLSRKYLPVIGIILSDWDLPGLEVMQKEEYLEIMPKKVCMKLE